MKSVLRTTGIVFLAVLAITALAAVGLLIASPHVPDMGAGTITVFDWSVPVDRVLQEGVGTLFVAWLAVWFALLVAFFAVLFAFGITVTVLFGVGLLLAAPFLFLGVIVWWMARRANRAADAAHTPLPPAAA
jgi:hypothetical protein